MFLPRPSDRKQVQGRYSLQMANVIEWRCLTDGTSQKAAGAQPAGAPAPAWRTPVPSVHQRNSTLPGDARQLQALVTRQPSAQSRRNQKGIPVRKQYYFRPSTRGLLAWDVDRLVQLSRNPPIRPRYR